MTTFARIAKILKGLIEPRNWVEEAFSDIGEGGGGGEKTPDITITVHATDLPGQGLTLESVDKTYDEVYASGKGLTHEVCAEIVIVEDEDELYRYRSMAEPTRPNPSSPPTYTFNQGDISFRQSGDSIQSDTIVFTLNSRDESTLNRYHYAINPVLE